MGLGAAITAVDSPRRERYYWGAILTTLALGTASGDLATEALSLGFRSGALLFGGLILVVWTLRRTDANAVLCFWIAYVLTRPLGASIGDLLPRAVTSAASGSVRASPAPSSCWSSSRWSPANR